MTTTTTATTNNGDGNGGDKDKDREKRGAPGSFMATMKIIASDSMIWKRSVMSAHDIWKRWLGSYLRMRCNKMKIQTDRQTG